MKCFIIPVITGGYSNVTKVSKTYGNNTGRAPNRGFANSSYVQKIPHIREVLQFEILSPCGGVHNWFKMIVTEEDNLR
jgi:hypothetical protein